MFYVVNTLFVILAATAAFLYSPPRRSMSVETVVDAVPSTTQPRTPTLREPMPVLRGNHTDVCLWVTRFCVDAAFFCH